MSIEAELEGLKAKLSKKEKQIALLLALDMIRDSSDGHSGLLSGVAEFLATQFAADAVLLYLHDGETKSLNLERSILPKDAGDDTKPADRLPAANFLGALGAKNIAVFEAGSVHECVRRASRLFPSMHCAVVTISMHGIMLGYIVAGRTGAKFTAEDVELLAMAENQVDSAVIQAKKSMEIRQKNMELEAIRRIDAIRDRCLPFEEMIGCTLKEIARTVTGETAFLMLYDIKADSLELKGVSNSDYDFSRHYVEIEAIARNSLKGSGITVSNVKSGSGRSVMCKPLILDQKIIGVLGMLNNSGGVKFSHADRAIFTDIASQIDTAIFEGIERARLKQVLGRSVDARVLDKLLDDSAVDFLKGEREVITVLYADVRGSTKLAEMTEPETLVGFINDYLGSMTEVILKNHGTLDKFVGDEVMALFGAPIRSEDHALTAIKVGLEMVATQKRVLERWKGKIPFPAPIGVGIATGELIVGEMGCEKRAEYTVIGRAANLGSRICGKAGADEVLISECTYEMAKDGIIAEPIKGLKFKGIEEDVTVFKVTGVR